MIIMPMELYVNEGREGEKLLGNWERIGTVLSVRSGWQLVRGEAVLNTGLVVC